MTAAVAVIVTCPPCRDEVIAQRDVYAAYAPAYLCSTHTAIWNAADERAHADGKCPHTPKRCLRCEP